MTRGAGTARLLAELLVRWSGMAMAAGLALAGMWVEVAVSMLVALAQVIAWRSRLPWGWEVATSLACLVAALSSFARLYERVPWWDLPVHAVLTGLLAVLALQVLGALPGLQVLRVLPGPQGLRVLGALSGLPGLRASAPTMLCIVLAGALLAVVWEGMELAGHFWVDPTVDVAPADTATDLLAGLVGSIGAALLWRRTEHPADGR